MSQESLWHAATARAASATAMKRAGEIGGAAVVSHRVCNPSPGWPLWHYFQGFLALGNRRYKHHHFALDELQEAVTELEHGDDMLAAMIDGKRLRDISDPPLDLAI